MKRAIAAIGLSVLTACSALAAVSCRNSQTTETNEDLSYVSLSINPEIGFVVDENNVVVSVRGENEDGKVLLYGQTDVEGSDLSVAVRIVTSEAVNLGYLSDENSVVDLTVSAKDGKKEAELKGLVNAGVEWTENKVSFRVSISEEGAYSLNRRLEAFKEQYPDNDAVQSLTVQKFKLAISASQAGEITLEAAVAMSETELIEIIRNAKEEIEDIATKAYDEAKKQASAAYEQAVAINANRAYTEFYAQSFLKGEHTDTFYYGAAYHLYSSSAVAFDYIYKTACSLSDILEYPLNEEQIAAVLTALNLTEEDVALLSDEQGNVTIRSVEAYADKLFKNSEGGQALEEKKTALTEALNGIQKSVREELDNVYELYGEQIDSAIATAKSALYTVKICLPVGVQNMIDDYVKDLTDIVTALETTVTDGTVTLEELKTVVDTLEAKAQEYYEKMREDLSEDEWKEVEKRRKDIVDSMNTEKREMEKQLEEAKRKAEEELTARKEERRENSKIHIEIEFGDKSGNEPSPESQNFPKDSSENN